MPRTGHKGYLLWAGIIIVILIAGFFIFLNLPSRYAPALPQTTTSAPVPASFPKNIPPPASTDYTAAQTNFQYLVSYTDRGFVPQSLSVKKGETVRFTNNSSASMNLTLPDATSHTLVHAAYVEYTFNTAGTFNYSDGTNEGTVVVK